MTPAPAPALPAVADRYDAVVIGAGMSGLAAGIRLALAGRKVAVFERHYAPGGLNSFYQMGRREFDVGLHALTNYVPAGTRAAGPLVRILRQLRIDRDELDLCPQRASRVTFSAGPSLRFSNDPALLEAEVERAFPASADRFRRLVAQVRGYDDTRLDPPRESAREVLGTALGEPALVDALLLPILYYGSPTPDDLDWLSAVILFKALYLEGFARPFAGVRRILQVLVRRLRGAGGELRLRCGVRRIRLEQGRAVGVELDDGRQVSADLVFSSAGLPETVALLGPAAPPPAAAAAPRGTLSFTETLEVYDRPTAELGWGEETIVFFQEGDRVRYRRPDDEVDPGSGVICFPNNYDYGARRPSEGVLRVTSLANPDRWRRLDPAAYAARKRHWRPILLAAARRFLPPVDETALAAARCAEDAFTPTTIERFTGRLDGAVYGSPVKRRDGRLPGVDRLVVIGTDQGYLGIVGALVSGLTLANLHGLRPASGDATSR